MKKIITLALAIILTVNVLYAQANQQISNIIAITKVWGVLEHYHPDLAIGKLDWDKELTGVVPLAESAPSQNAFHALITYWYYSLPKAKLIMNNHCKLKKSLRTVLKHLAHDHPILQQNKGH